MKTCPKCNRTFPDEGQKFCTFDGGLLIAPQNFDPNATIRATSIDLNAASERPTSRDLPDPNATMIDNSATVALPGNTGPTGYPTNAPNTADIAGQAPSAASQPPDSAPPSYVPPPPPPPASPPPAQVSQPLPPSSSAQQTSAPLTAPQGAATSARLPSPPVAKKKSKAPLIIAGVLLFLLLSGGVLAGVFFFVIKPKLDEMAAAEGRQSETAPVVQPTAETTPVVEQPSPAPEDTFVPPPNTVQFENSNANLDGKLAEHYFDFSFYYPQSWQLDPKAGVPGAGNFVKVERRLSPESIQENFAVGWYTSSGTFAGDLRSFPQRAQEVSAALAKAYPEYRKVSEGPTKVNTMDAYEFRWEGLSKAADDSDVNLWGRVVFLPTGKEGDTTGATIVMLSTSLAPELSSVEDIGEKGEAKVILDSFRFGKK
jgi:hypothetical protein